VRKRWTAPPRTRTPDRAITLCRLRFTIARASPIAASVSDLGGDSGNQPLFGLVGLPKVLEGLQLRPEAGVEESRAFARVIAHARGGLASENSGMRTDSASIGSHYNSGAVWEFKGQLVRPTPAS
jgi:hypothetical protein